jgi:hypothetical protein
MTHCFDAVERRRQHVGIPHVAPHVVRGVRRAVRHAVVRCRVEVVDDDDVVTAGDQLVDHVRTHEPGAAGDQHPHACPCSFDLGSR